MILAGPGIAGTVVGCYFDDAQGSRLPADIWQRFIPWLKSAADRAEWQDEEFYGPRSCGLEGYWPEAKVIRKHLLGATQQSRPLSANRTIALFAATAVLTVLLVCGGGGFLVWYWLKPSPSEPTQKVEPYVFGPVARLNRGDIEREAEEALAIEERNAPDNSVEVLGDDIRFKPVFKVKPAEGNKIGLIYLIGRHESDHLNKIDFRRPIPVLPSAATAFVVFLSSQERPIRDGKFSYAPADHQLRDDFDPALDPLVGPGANFKPQPKWPVTAAVAEFRSIREKFDRSRLEYRRVGDDDDADQVELHFVRFLTPIFEIKCKKR